MSDTYDKLHWLPLHCSIADYPSIRNRIALNRAFLPPVRINGHCARHNPQKHPRCTANISIALPPGYLTSFGNTQSKISLIIHLSFPIYGISDQQDCLRGVPCSFLSQGGLHRLGQIRATSQFLSSAEKLEILVKFQKKDPIKSRAPVIAQNA